MVGLIKKRFVILLTSAVVKESLDIQATIECRFILKRVRDMIMTYIQMHRTYSTHNIAQSFNRFG